MDNNNYNYNANIPTNQKGPGHTMGIIAIVLSSIGLVCLNLLFCIAGLLLSKSAYDQDALMNIINTNAKTATTISKIGIIITVIVYALITIAFISLVAFGFPMTIDALANLVDEIF